MCTVLCFLLTAGALYFPGRRSPELMLTGAAASVSWAAYLLWADERSRFATVCSYLSKPDIHCSVERCFCLSRGSGVYLLIDADLANGSIVPTTLKSAMLELVIHGNVHRSRNRSPFDPQANFRTAGLSPTQLQTRGCTDLITEISAHPLEMGVHKSGSFVFLFDSLPALPSSLALRLSLEDAYGNRHMTEQTLQGENGMWLA